jgi:hypothetical protein
MAFGKKATSNDAVVINPPNFKLVRVPIRGDTSYVSNAFAQEAQHMMAADQAKGQIDKAKGRGAKKPPKDFEAQYRGSLHQSTEGWYGIPVIAFRAAMVRSSSLVGIEMTRAKMCLFVVADGFDKDGQGLVQITKGTPERFDAFAKNSNGGADIRSRGRFAPGWEATITMKYDGDFLSQASVVNLLARAGVCVGVGAGRPFSSMSVGQGWGSFYVVTEETKEAAAE